MHLNLQIFMESITSNKKLQSILLGNNFLYAGKPETTPLYVHALTVNSYIQSAYKCIKGGSQISKLLIKQLRNYGADIFKRTEIEKTVFNEDGSIQSVISKHENRFFADKFIFNTDIYSTLRIVGEENFKKSFVNRIKSWKPISSCFSVYLVLKKNEIPYFNYNYYHFHSLEYVFESIENQQLRFPAMYMLSSSPSKHNKNYCESLTAISYMNFDEVKNWASSVNTLVEENDRGLAYEKFKKEKAERIIKKKKKKIPNLRNAIQSVYTSSPLSYRDYIGSFEGNMYGYSKESSNPLKTMVSPKTKIPNLYLTGQSVNMHGILGVTIGAFSTCSEIVGKEVIHERLKSV